MIDNIIYRLFGVIDNFFGYLFELFWGDPANIEKVIVNESEGKKIETYFIKNLEPNFAEQLIILILISL